MYALCLYYEYIHRLPRSILGYRGFSYIKRKTFLLRLRSIESFFVSTIEKQRVVEWGGWGWTRVQILYMCIERSLVWEETSRKIFLKEFPSNRLSGNSRKQKIAYSCLAQEEDEDVDWSVGRGLRANRLGARVRVILMDDSTGVGWCVFTPFSFETDDKEKWKVACLYPS